MTAVTDANGLDLGAYLRPGDHIVWGQACGEPTTLVEALIAQAERIGGLSAFAATSFSGLLSADAAAKFNNAEFKEQMKEFQEQFRNGDLQRCLDDAARKHDETKSAPQPPQ